jgi:hypothetical protein
MTEVKTQKDTASRIADATSSGTDDRVNTQMSEHSDKSGSIIVDIQDQIEDAVKAALIEAAGEKVEGGVIAAPSTKTVTTRGLVTSRCRH